MIDPKMTEREGVLYFCYSLYIWILFFYVYENFASTIFTGNLDGYPLIEGPTTADLYKSILIFLLMIVSMIIIAHCSERFLRSNLFFPLMNMLLSGMSIIVLFEHFIFAAGFSDGNKAAIAAITFMSLRLLLFADSFFLLRKYFRQKNINK